MGTTSEKLTYLNTTKGLIKDSINLTGANILSTDTFRSYATKLKNGLVDIINNGIDTLYDNFPKVSGEGTEIALNNTYEAPIKLNVVKGDTTQNIYSGKNQIGLQDLAETTKNGLKYSVSNGVLTVDGTASGKVDFQQMLFNLTQNTSKTLYFYLESGTFTAGAIGIHLNQDIDTQISFIQIPYSTTNLKTTKTIGLSNVNQVWVYTILNSVFNNAKFRIMLSDNNNDTYEPYVGGNASPNPDYPQEVKVVTGLQNVNVNGTNYEVDLGTLELCKINDYQDTLQKSSGKNQIGLQDLSSTTTNAITYSISNGVFSINGTASAKTTIQNILFNLTTNTSKRLKVYLESGTFTAGAIGISLRDSNNEQISFIQMAYSIQDLDTTKTISLIGVDHIELYVTSGATFGNAKFRIILVDSGESISYEPYGKVWYKKQMIRKIQLNISDMNNSENYPGWNNVPYISNDYSNTNTYLNDVTKWKSNISANNNAIAINTNNNAKTMYLNKNVFNLTQTDWKTNYPNLTFVVYYYLQTPAYEIITNSTLINQLEGIKSKEDSTNITISGNLPMIINASALEKE